MGARGLPRVGRGVGGTVQRTSLVRLRNLRWLLPVLLAVLFTLGDTVAANSGKLYLGGVTLPIKLVIFSALFVALFIVADNALNRLFEPGGSPPNRAPGKSIRVPVRRLQEVQHAQAVDNDPYMLDPLAYRAAPRRILVGHLSAALGALWARNPLRPPSLCDDPAAGCVCRPGSGPL